MCACMNAETQLCTPIPPSHTQFKSTSGWPQTSRAAAPLLAVCAGNRARRNGPYLFTTSFRVLWDPFTRQIASCRNPESPMSLMPTISSPASNLSTAAALLPSSICNKEACPVSPPKSAKLGPRAQPGGQHASHPQVP